MKTSIAILLSLVVMTPAQAYDLDNLRSSALMAVYDGKCEHFNPIADVEISAVQILMSEAAPNQAMTLLSYMGDWEQQLNATGKAEWCARAKVVIATFFPDVYLLSKKC